MSELLDNLNEVLNRCQPEFRHSLFQLKHFVLGKEPTLQAKLRKALNELAVRKESLENMELALEDLDDDIELIDLKIERIKERKKEATDGLDIKALDIQIKKTNRKKKSIYSKISSLIKQQEECKIEANFFLNAFLSLEKIEPLKPFDDIETNKEFWNEKYTQMLNLMLLLQKPLDFELVNCVLALDKDTPIRKELVHILDQVQAKALEHNQKKLAE